RARGRRAAARRRLPAPVVPLLPVARARGARADLPAADASLPLAAPAAQGGGAEPVLGRGELRDARARLPLRRRARRRLGPLPRSAGRGLDPDLPLRDALRPLDRLR